MNQFLQITMDSLTNPVIRKIISEIMDESMDNIMDSVRFMMLNNNEVEKITKMTILEIPSEIMEIIMVYSGSLAVLKLGRTCKYFRNLSRNKYVWKIFHQEYLASGGPGKFHRLFGYPDDEFLTKFVEDYKFIKWDLIQNLLNEYVTFSQIDQARESIVPYLLKTGRSCKYIKTLDQLTIDLAKEPFHYIGRISKIISLRWNDLTLDDLCTYCFDNIFGLCEINDCPKLHYEVPEILMIELIHSFRRYCFFHQLHRCRSTDGGGHCRFVHSRIPKGLCAADFTREECKFRSDNVARKCLRKHRDDYLPSNHFIRLNQWRRSQYAKKHLDNREEYFRPPSTDTYYSYSEEKELSETTSDY